MRRIFPLLLALALALTGCVGQDSGADLAAYAPAEEQRLVVYTSHKEEVYWPILKEFEERTGIWVEVVTGGTNELLERIDRERDDPVADVMFGGGVESLGSYRDCFTPYAADQADHILPQYRAEDDLWTPFSALPVVLIYNTKLVDARRLTGWSDLLSEDLRGHIAFGDPAVSGSCYTGLVTLLYAVGGDEDDTIRRFAENLDGQQLDSSGAVTEAVAAGNALVGVCLEDAALQHQADGDDLGLVYPADGTSCVPDGSALVKGAPHEDNAKLFLDFTVSRDAQQLLGERFYRRTVRDDLEPETGLTDLDEVALVDYDVSWATQRRDALLMTWAFYLTEEETP